MMFERMRIDKKHSIKVGEEEFENKNLYETLFTIGNGYVGIRGILENENGIYPGTYIAGIYGGEKNVEIVNLPNPLSLKIFVDDVEMNSENMKILNHKRILDTKYSTLHRETVYSDGKKEIRYRSVRFFSINHPNIGIMYIEILPINQPVEILIKKYIDTTTRNEQRAIGGPMKHYTVDKFGRGENYIYLDAITNHTKYRVNFVIGTFEEDWEFNSDECGIYMLFKREVSEGYPLRLLFPILVRTTRDSHKPMEENLKDLKRINIEDIITLNKRAWRKRWKSSEVKVSSENITAAINFDLHHLLIAAREDIDASIPAKTYSGEWYKGHIFWDNEIYAFPFFAVTQPKIAKNLLLYRYRRIDKAREKAKKMGYKGILWPWESADTGEEETPDTWVNFDGSIIPVYTHKREIHIAGDVAYAINYYYRATGDLDFMLRYGAEIIFETARFFASRVEEINGKYEIRCVIGPNEFHHCVHNNSYTNYLAKWCLKYAYDLYDKLKKKHPNKLKEIKKRILLSENEVNEWAEISNKIVFLMHENGLIEEFEGYLSLKDVVIKEWDKNGMPVWPKEVKLEEVDKTQLVKQADVILLLHLFSKDFSTKVKKINLEYYEKRTTHKSSLSVPSYAIINAEIGNIDKAYKYFLNVLYADLKNIYGNTHLGIHAATMGGMWQILFHGFMGARLYENFLEIEPRIPEELGELHMRFYYHGNLIESVASPEKLTLRNIKGKEDVRVKYKNEYYVLRKKGVLNL